MSSAREKRLDDMQRQFVKYPKGVAVSLLTQLYEVDRTTIFRDIQELIGRGVQLERIGGYWKLHLPGVQLHTDFTVYEVVALLMGARLLAHQSDEQNPHVTGALEKLGKALQPYAPRVASLISEAGQEVAEHPSQTVYVAVFEALVRAWVEQFKVRIVYRSAQATEASERLFSPYFLEPANGGYGVYALGFDEASHEIRTFKLERMLAATLTDEPFITPADFGPHSVFGSAWGVMWGTANIAVQLRFDAGVVRRLKETFWHSTQKLEDLPDGACLFTVHIAHTLEIIPWIRSWGVHVEVLAPATLRLTFAEEARQLAERYQMGM